MHTQKLVAFVHTNNEQSEKEIMKTVLFTMALKRVKYLGINLLKEVEDLYNENYKTLLKGNKEGINKWKHIPVFLDWTT